MGAKNSMIIDLTGQKFNSLTVVKMAEKTSKKHTHWICECVCGNKRKVRSDQLKNGNIKSCGCMNPVRKRGNKTNNKKCARCNIRERYNGGTYCKKCADEVRTLARILVNSNKMLGLCVKCSSEDERTIRGLTRCKKCCDREAYNRLRRLGKLS